MGVTVFVPILILPVLAILIFSLPLVLNTKSCASVVPRKCVPGVVPLFPVRCHSLGAFPPNVTVETAGPCVSVSVLTPVVVLVEADKVGDGTFTVYCRVDVLLLTEAIFAVEEEAGNIVGGTIVIVLLYPPVLEETV